MIMKKIFFMNGVFPVTRVVIREGTQIGSFGDNCGTVKYDQLFCDTSIALFTSLSHLLVEKTKSI